MFFRINQVNLFLLIHNIINLQTSQLNRTKLQLLSSIIMLIKLVICMINKIWKIDNFKDKINSKIKEALINLLDLSLKINFEIIKIRDNLDHIKEIDNPLIYIRKINSELKEIIKIRDNLLDQVEVFNNQDNLINFLNKLEDKIINMEVAWTEIKEKNHLEDEWN